MAIEGPLKAKPGVRQEGRSRRAKAKQAEVPGASFCGECLLPFKGDLDLQWWNADDPSQSKWVCTSCWLALTEKRRQDTEAAAREANKPSLASEEETANMIHVRIVAAHVHKWTYLGMTGGSEPYHQFYCSECPHDNPTFKELRPERIAPNNG